MKQAVSVLTRISEHFDKCVYLLTCVAWLQFTSYQQSQPKWTVMSDIVAFFSKPPKDINWKFWSVRRLDGKYNVAGEQQLKE